MRFRLSPLAGTLVSLFLLAPTTPPSNGDEEPRAIDNLEKGLHIQTRGPVHEAFAQPLDLTPQPGLVVPKEPPPPINEEPPEQRPEGENVQWIPGYWAWDAERNEFLWVSGVHRLAPADRQYVPGYWVREGDGWRWVRGFWAPAAQQQLPYVPQPPATLELGPSVPPPDDNYAYAPGCWVWREPRWLWRPGFWSPCRPGRVWIAAHHLWTPAGCVFVDGYWDYPLEQRGCLYAPVYFAEPLWRRPGWCHRPSIVVHVGSLFDCFFVQRGGYHFGDYYGPSYARAGYRPWCATGGFDPLFHYERWHHRRDPGWATGLRQVHADRSAGRLPAPPRTFAPQLAAGGPGAAPVLATPLASVNKVANTVKVRPTATAEQQAFVKSTQRVRDLAQTRSQVETALAANAGPNARSGRALELRSAGSGTPPASAPITPRKKDGPSTASEKRPTLANTQGNSASKSQASPPLGSAPKRQNQAPAANAAANTSGPPRLLAPGVPSQGPKLTGEGLPRGPERTNQGAPSAPPPGSSLPPLKNGKKADAGASPRISPPSGPLPGNSGAARPGESGSKPGKPAPVFRPPDPPLRSVAPGGPPKANASPKPSDPPPRVDPPPRRAEPPPQAAPRSTTPPKKNPSTSAPPPQPRFQPPAAPPRSQPPASSPSKAGGGGSSFTPRSSPPSSPPAVRGASPRSSGPAPSGGGNNRGGNSQGGGGNRNGKR